MIHYDHDTYQICDSSLCLNVSRCYARSLLRCCRTKNIIFGAVLAISLLLLVTHKGVNYKNIVAASATVQQHRRLGDPTTTTTIIENTKNPFFNFSSWLTSIWEKEDESVQQQQQVNEYNDEMESNESSNTVITSNNVDNQIIVRFDDLATNEDGTERTTVVSREEIEVRAQKVADYLGGTVVQVYQHVFYGATIGNIPTTTSVSLMEHPNDTTTTSTNSRTYRTFTRPTTDTSVTATITDLPNFTYEIDMTVGKRYQLSFSEVDLKVQEDPPEQLDRINQMKLPLDQTYKYKYNGSGVTVFVVDTGIRTTHVELAQIPTITCGYTAFPDEVIVLSNDNDDQKNACDDLNGHGTHVAGSIASQTYGVAKGVNLVAVKVLDRNGSGSYTTLLGGIEYMIQYKIDNPTTPMVSNLSLAGGKSDYLNDAVQKAINNNIVMVVAAGNDGTDACNVSPASLPSAITVGASLQTIGSLSIITKMFPWFFRQERQAEFSNYGSCVDILTWGCMVKSLGIDGVTSTALKTGTSMATPYVTGAAALYLSRNPYMTPQQVHDAIIADASTSQLRRSYQNGSPNRVLNTDKIM